MATLCHSVRSLFSPDCLSFQLSLVATRMFATVMPEGMARVSGSAPRLPIKMTLLIPRAMAVCPSSKEICGAGLYGQPSHRCSQESAALNAVRILTNPYCLFRIPRSELHGVTFGNHADRLRRHVACAGGWRLDRRRIGRPVAVERPYRGRQRHS